MNVYIRERLDANIYDQLINGTIKQYDEIRKLSARQAVYWIRFILKTILG